MIAQLDPIYIKTRPGKAINRLLSHFLFQGRFLTTKYRWLNPLILAELALLKRLPQLRSVEKPIFVIGTGRSGSTILGKVLSMHRHVGFLNEPKAMWYTIDSREDVNGHFTQGQAQYRYNAHDVTSQINDNAHRLYSAYLAITGSQRVLDKNPELVFRIPFVKTIFPDAKFLFLVRNGWNTVSSIVKWSQLYGRKTKGHVEDWWGVDQRKYRFLVEQLVPSEPMLSASYENIKLFTRHEDMAAVEWIVTMQEGLRYMQSLPDSVYPVSFEDLTQSPESTLEKLMAFCELQDDAVFLSYAKQTLSPQSNRQPIILPRDIRDPFFETLKALQYQVTE